MPVRRRGDLGQQPAPLRDGLQYPPQRVARLLHEPRTAPSVTTPDRLPLELAPGPLRLVGSGAPLIRAALPEGRPVAIESAELDARCVARRAARRLAHGEVPQAGSSLRPLYLRPPDARPRTPLVAPARAEAVEA